MFGSWWRSKVHGASRVSSVGCSFLDQLAALLRPLFGPRDARTQKKGPDGPRLRHRSARPALLGGVLRPAGASPSGPLEQHTGFRSCAVSSLAPHSRVVSSQSLCRLNNLRVLGSDTGRRVPLRLDAASYVLVAHAFRESAPGLRFGGPPPPMGASAARFLVARCPDGRCDSVFPARARQHSPLWSIRPCKRRGPFSTR